MLRKQVILLLFWSFACLHLYAQSRVKYEKVEAEIFPSLDGKSVTLRRHFTDTFGINMIVLQAKSGEVDFSKVKVSAYYGPRTPDGQRLWGYGTFVHLDFSNDPHAPEFMNQSLPVLIPPGFDDLQITGSIDAINRPSDLVVWFFKVPELVKPVQPEKLKNRQTCSSPSIIPQSTWRAGLDSPILGRTSSPTHHCVIHHSAGNTNDTDYIKVVRAYYVYHTTVNGWDDIGYNYLVDPKGAVYAGRDPEKSSIAQDEVTGAHFCGKNQNTMGVCVIGNYMEAEPSDTAISSLKLLLGWKVNKDNLNVTGQMIHPVSGGDWLPVIAGHRDGCATSCPGDKLYPLLSSLRTALIPCSPSANLLKKPLSPEVAVMNSSGIVLKVTADVLVYNSAGQLIVNTKAKAGQEIRLPRNQILVLTIRQNNQIFHHKVFIP